MNIRLALVASLALSSYVAATHAHHSFAAMYDSNKPIRLVGTLSKVEWTNPHSFFHLDVVAKDGTVSKWACEGAGPALSVVAVSTRATSRSATS